MRRRPRPRLLPGERRARPRGKGPTLPRPRRRPADGLIDWSQPSSAVYDFVRALTRPYPGAFSLLDGQRWMIWSAALLPDGNGEAHRVAGIVPGQALGPIVSPVEAACGQLVACGTRSEE